MTILFHRNLEHDCAERRLRLDFGSPIQISSFQILSRTKALNVSNASLHCMRCAAGCFFRYRSIRPLSSGGKGRLSPMVTLSFVGSPYIGKILRTRAAASSAFRPSSFADKKVAYLIAFSDFSTFFRTKLGRVQYSSISSMVAPSAMAGAIAAVNLALAEGSPLRAFFHKALRSFL